MNSPSDYTCHSGGAQGADLMWDAIGKEYGVETIHWRPEDLLYVSEEDRQDILLSVKNAAIALARPQSFRGIELVQRNWLQVRNSEAIFAVSRIIEPSKLDKGFVNKSGRQVISGGTGWAVEMAIQKNKLVYVFDMINNRWKNWDYYTLRFLNVDMPVLTKIFAGIGSRQMNSEGIQAIRDVYALTFPKDPTMGLGCSNEQREKMK